jgi:4-hydroxybenzoate polyprenyltransferase
MSFWKAAFESIRPWQWIKNLFVAAPIVFSGQMLQTDALTAAAGAVLAFCLASSTVYLTNDIADAAADRRHPIKRNRPIASGALSSFSAITIALVLLAAATLIGFLIGKTFLLLLGAYLGLFALYSLGLKRIAVLDVVLIASGFVLRVLAGSSAIHVEASHWLLLCTFLVALYLGFVKRRHELILQSGTAADRPAFYTTTFLDQAESILIAATLVCYACYTVAPETVARFGTDALIYGIVFVIYGLLRYLGLSASSTEGEDPARLLLKDRPLQLAVLGWAVFNILIVYRDRLGLG